MDLTTQYLGLSLSSPFMVGSSPMPDDLDTVKRLEDAGASAVVMPSIFEEQITREELGTVLDMDVPAESSAEALSYFPDASGFKSGPCAQLEQLRKVKEAVSVPVIGSLNGATPRGWVKYASQIEEAGADALELNIYFMATDASQASEKIEKDAYEIVRGIKSEITIPLSVKISSFYSSLPHFISGLVEAGASGIVIFNRFLQPDINIESLEIEPRLQLSDPSELLVRLRWLAILSGQTKATLACSGGVHSVDDAIKAVMAGADVVQLVSAVMRNGSDRFKAIRDGFSRWMDEHEYESLEQLRGSMNHSRCPNPQALERANYLRVLQGWREGSV